MWPLTADLSDEEDETVVFELLASNYALGADTSASGTILDDDTPTVVTFEADPVSALEDNAERLV